MWKVLIADDEPKIRRGLKALVSSFGFDLEVVAEAEDGETAIRLVGESDPDIMLVDVRMPFLGGLEFLERIKATSPGKIVIIVSGHDEFEYAQQALRLGVFDYVLKPVDGVSFRAIVERGIAELESRRAADRREAWAFEQLDRSLPLLRERFLRDWVTGSLSRTEVSEGLSFLKIALASPAALLGARLSERSRSNQAGTEQGRRLALVALRTVIEQALPPDGAYVFEDDTDTVLAIAPGCSAAALAALAEAIEKRAAELVYQTPSVATRAVPEPRDGFEDAYEELCAELSGADGSESFVVLARNFIDKHYWNPGLCLEDAAAELQISPGYLSRLMKRQTGFSFVEYLNRIRVKKATILMSDPAAKAFEVAERVGYRSQHYFSRAFKKVTGTSPTEHRKGPQA